VHRTLHCAMSGAPAAARSKSFSCALSGVHRTGTVDCLVRPYSVFKIPFPCSRPRPGTFFSVRSSCLCALAVSTPSPASSPLGWPPCSGDPPGIFLGCAPLSSLVSTSPLCLPSLSLSLHFSGQCSPLHPFCAQFQFLSNPVNPGA
jgi:hypothetical protein